MNEYGYSIYMSTTVFTGCLSSFDLENARDRISPVFPRLVVDSRIATFAKESFIL